jgi:hypothetical protein
MTNTNEYSWAPPAQHLSGSAQYRPEVDSVEVDSLSKAQSLGSADADFSSDHWRFLLDATVNHQSPSLEPPRETSNSGHTNHIYHSPIATQFSVNVFPESNWHRATEPIDLVQQNQPTHIRPIDTVVQTQQTLQHPPIPTEARISNRPGRKGKLQCEPCRLAKRGYDV